MASLVERREPSPSRSTLNADPAGTQALFRVLRDLGVDARRWRAAHESLGNEHGLLVIVAPFEQMLESAAAKSIVAWVERGNALLLLTDAGEPLASKTVPWSDEALLAELGWKRGGLPSGNAANDSDLSAIWIGTEAANDATLAIPSPLLGTGQRVRGGSGIRMAAPEGGWAPLLGGDVGTRGWLRRLGRGEVAVIATPSIAENRWIDREANLGFLLALVARLRRDRPVLFDETVHGHRELPPAAKLDVGARRMLAAQVLLAGVVYVLARGRRLGPALAPAAARSRSVVELAESMGMLYRRAAVSREVLASLARDARAAGTVPPELEAALERVLRARRVRRRDLLRLDRWITRTTNPENIA